MHFEKSGMSFSFAKSASPKGPFSVKVTAIGEAEWSFGKIMVSKDLKTALRTDHSGWAGQLRLSTSPAKK